MMSAPPRSTNSPLLPPPTAAPASSLSSATLTANSMPRIARAPSATRSILSRNNQPSSPRHFFETFRSSCLVFPPHPQHNQSGSSFLLWSATAISLSGSLRQEIGDSGHARRNARQTNRQSRRFHRSRGNHGNCHRHSAFRAHQRPQPHRLLYRYPESHSDENRGSRSPHAARRKARSSGPRRLCQPWPRHGCPLRRRFSSRAVHRSRSLDFWRKVIAILGLLLERLGIGKDASIAAAAPGPEVRRLPHSLFGDTIFLLLMRLFCISIRRAFCLVFCVIPLFFAPFSHAQDE